MSGTIADNLRWGDADADADELENACRIAQAWEFVSQTSNGLETKVTQGGRSLSGGQKQRLTIARALVGHPRLLILDDSMSALDYATDLELRRQLASKMGDVTKIMISQRATSIQHADHILVMDDGRCVGYGTRCAIGTMPGLCGHLPHPDAVRRESHADRNSANFIVYRRAARNCSECCSLH